MPGRVGACPGSVGAWTSPSSAAASPASPSLISSSRTMTSPCSSPPRAPAAIPDGDDDAVHRVVVGTVMLEPLLLTLRMMAHREHAMRMIPLAPLPPAADAGADAR